MRKSTIIISLLALALNAWGQMSYVLYQVETNNLSLKALKHDIEADVLDIRSENTLAGPSLEYSPFFNKGYSGVASSELVVSEEFDFPTKYAARRRQAQLQSSLGDSRYALLRRDVLLRAQLLYIDIVRSNQVISMLSRRLDGDTEVQRMYETRMEAGDANILELNKVRLDRIEVQGLVAQSVNERTDMLRQLQELNGNTPIEVTDTLFPEIDDIAISALLSDSISAHDPRISQSEAAMVVAKGELRISRQDWLPDISVGYRRNTEMNESSNGVLVGLSFPLLSTKNRVRAARQRLQSAAYQAQMSRDEVVSERNVLIQQFRQLRSVLDHSDLRMMHETLSLLTKALKHGEISALQYYTEINSIYDKLQRHIDLHAQYAKVWAELNKNKL